MRQIEVLHEFQHCSSASISENITTPIATGAITASSSPPQSTIGIGNRTSSIDSGMTGHATTSSGGSGKVNYVIEELKTTEESYVRELREIIEYYIKPFDAPENYSQFPPQLRGQSKGIFGNIQTLYKFHERLSHCFNSTDSIVEICHLIIDRRRDFLSLYRPYCQNKPISEAIRNEHHIESMKFFIDCQQRAGHLLPLSSYLLKPIQRVTKYQLLLKELLRYSPDDVRKDVTAALAAMLDLLSQLNADLNQLHISAFAGDLHLLGPLRLQTECFVYSFKRKTHRVSNKPQRRFLFLFDGGVLFCKKRTQPLPYAPEYYEHKMCIPMKDLGFSESSRSESERFDIWDGTKSDGYAVQPIEEAAKVKWIQRLSKLTSALGHYHNKPDQQSVSSSNHSHNHSTSSSSRPQSWTSDGTVSSRGSGGYDDMSASSSSHTQGTDFTLVDPNGNPSSAPVRRQSSSATSTYSDVDNRYGSSHVTTIQIAPKHPSNHGLDSVALPPPDSSNYSLNAILESHPSQNELIAK
uniref:DH domain-containing protein n=1 Tax=Panagrolaimus superbus TaxID=310955 RepID=A0A914YTF7_9BILA